MEFDLYSYVVPRDREFYVIGADDFVVAQLFVQTCLLLTRKAAKGTLGQIEKEKELPRFSHGYS